jgi:O-6-methylguanine DNA methyltransferase
METKIIYTGLVVSETSYPICRLVVEMGQTSDIEKIDLIPMGRDISNEQGETKPICSELANYILNKPATPISHPHFRKTAFSKKVYDILYHIPYGKTLTYRDIAIQAGSENSARAVGNAMRTNPLPLLYPCHRVVGLSNLGGFAGKGDDFIEIKRKLLEIEGRGEQIKIVGGISPVSSSSPTKILEENYFSNIWRISIPHIQANFEPAHIKLLENQTNHLYSLSETSDIISKWTDIYIDFVKNIYQSKYQKSNADLHTYLNEKNSQIKIIWGNCLDVLKSMKSESIHLMVTSPPYYNAREYSQWKNLNDYLHDMRLIIREAYRVLDNHRVFVFNVGDVFGNDNLHSTSTWGKRRIPLGAYFTQIFEEEGWAFVDDFIWDKGEVQSERHKSGDKPYPFYQYPMNCYEHIFVFHKHRDDKTKYPCPVCGCLKVNGNAMSEIGLRSWECKNLECFERSEANRGKRFSLKTIMTQGRQITANVIGNDYIKKWRRDIIKINPVIKINCKGENKLGHTAPFPTEIPEFAIRMFSYPGEFVLDPFGGSFTSAITAKKNDRIGIGIEMNKEMFRDASLQNIRNQFFDGIFEDGDALFSEFDFCGDKK